MISLFELATAQSRWLAVRQAAIAENVANATTPGFQARDARPFALVLADLRAGGADGQSLTRQDERTWSMRVSGNSVSLEEEMVRAGAVQRAHALNTGIVSAFHRMTLAAARG